MSITLGHIFISKRTIHLGHDTHEMPHHSILCNSLVLAFLYTTCTIATTVHNNIIHYVFKFTILFSKNNSSNSGNYNISNDIWRMETHGDGRYFLSL